MLVALEKNVSRLCDETYKATKTKLTAKPLAGLIERAEAQIAEHSQLLLQYSGGQRRAVESAGRDIESLVGFTATLKTIASKSAK